VFKTIWFIFIFLIIFIIVFYLDNLPNIKNSNFVYSHSNLTSSLEFPNDSNNELINEVNQINSKIMNIYYPEIIIQSGNIKIESVFIYEKNKNFRMINWSIFGKESDIGSNNEYFWFWSKRMKPSALFYSKHENLSKTRLKTLFHPTWMMETIGIDKINLENSLVFNHESYIGIMQERMDVTNGLPVKRIYLIDKDKKACYGHYLFDEKNEPIVSFEVYDYHLLEGNIYVPKEIGIIWNKESIKLKWIMSKPIINSYLKSENWQIPEINPKIDLNGYIPTTFLAF
jgi:hypothetical protein